MHWTCPSALETKSDHSQTDGKEGDARSGRAARRPARRRSGSCTSLRTAPRTVPKGQTGGELMNAGETQEREGRTRDPAMYVMLRTSGSPMVSPRLLTMARWGAALRHTAEWVKRARFRRTRRNGLTGDQREDQR